jgi:hypothetical protein
MASRGIQSVRKINWFTTAIIIRLSTHAILIEP